MNSFIFNLVELPDILRNSIIKLYNLDSDGLHLVVFDTNKVDDENALINYILTKGFPDDIKIKLYKDCYPIKDNASTTMTNNISKKEEIVSCIKDSYIL